MVQIVFTEKSIDDCLKEIEFDPNNMIKIKNFEDYIGSIKYLGDPEFMSSIVLSRLMHNHYHEIHERILKGESFEIKYKPHRLTLDYFIEDIYFLLDEAYMFLENPPGRMKHVGFSFFSELFANTIQWGNNNSKNKDLEFYLRTSPKGSLVAINQENEWDYKKVVKIFQDGRSITSRKGRGGCGMMCTNWSPYEVGYTNNGKTTYILITKDTFDKVSKKVGE